MKTKILGLLVVGLAVGPMTAQSTPVVVGDKAWRQLTETLRVSWNQVATVCKPLTGVCSGSIGDISFDGWTWAGNKDIQGLFEELILPGSIQFPTPVSSYGQKNSPDIAAVFGPERFLPTRDFSVTNDSRYILGWSRDSWASDVNRAYGPFISDSAKTEIFDVASLAADYAKSDSGEFLGVWLYRAVPVPEPGTLALICIGLLGLGLSKIRRSVQPAAV